MPKVIVREIDNTKAVSATYSNFSVVIPGHVSSTTKWNDVADENGVYECSTVADFIEYIGKVNEVKKVDAEAPEESGEYSIGEISLDDAKQKVKGEKIFYTRADNVEGKAIGKLVSKEYIYTAVSNIEDSSL